MSAIPKRFNWREMSQFIGGIALVALVQTGLLFPDTRDFVGSWMIMALFGAIYAVIGGVTTDCSRSGAAHPRWSDTPRGIVRPVRFCCVVVLPRDPAKPVARGETHEWPSLSASRGPST
jgi:hypothetical protein